MNRTSENRVKSIGALLGGGAVILLAALSVSWHLPASDHATLGRPAAPTMSTGVTITAPKSPHTPLTTRAEPQIKGPAALPSEEEAAK